MLLLALGGLPLSLRRRPAPSLHYLIPAGLQLAALCFTGWYRWHGGSAPPGLLAVVLLPPAALFMAPVLAALSRPWWRLAWWLPAAIGLIYTWLLTLLPWMRLALPGTPNPMLLDLSRRLGLDLSRALPSGLAAGPRCCRPPASPWPWPPFTACAPGGCQLPPRPSPRGEPTRC